MDTSNAGAVEPGWDEVREYMPPYGAPQRLPDNPPANVARLDLFRVAPAGTKPETIDEAKAILATARDILLLGGWCSQDKLGAIGEGNFPCHPLDPKARRWSIGGAMVRAIGNIKPIARGTPQDIAWQALAHSVRARHQVAPNWFNDRIATSIHDVAAEFTAAIETLDERLATMGQKPLEQ